MGATPGASKRAGKGGVSRLKERLRGPGANGRGEGASRAPKDGSPAPLRAVKGGRVWSGGKRRAENSRAAGAPGSGRPLRDIGLAKTRQILEREHGTGGEMGSGAAGWAPSERRDRTLRWARAIF